MSGVMSLKLHLHDGNSTDIRRFTVEDPSVVTNLLFMRSKLQMIYPALQTCSYKITWKDQEGDFITISGDEDLITAFTEMSGNVKSLHIHVLEKDSVLVSSDDEDEGQPQPQPLPTNHRVFCDSCNNTITGIRYKCMQCPDYDLCSTCEHKGLHSEHIMIRTTAMVYFTPRHCRKMMHHAMRSFKKAQYHAAKEAARGAKHAHKAFNRYFSGRDEENRNENTSNQEKEQQQSTSSKQQSGIPPFGGGCPMQNLSAFVEPFIEGIFANPNVQSAPSASGTGANANAKSDGNPHTNANANINANQNPLGNMPIADLIRDGINSFFEYMNTVQPPQGQGQNQSSSTSASSAAQATSATPQQNNTPNTQNNNGNGASTSQGVYPNIPAKETTPVFKPSAPGQASAPMETEPTTNTILIDLESNNGKPGEPGWTIIGGNEPNQINTAPENVPQTQPQPQTQASSTSKPTGTVDPQSIKISEGLKQLLEMGFSNELNLVALLKRYDGNVGFVVKHLFENNM